MPEEFNLTEEAQRIVRVRKVSDEELRSLSKTGKQITAEDVKDLVQRRGSRLFDKEQSEKFTAAVNAEKVANNPPGNTEHDPTNGAPDSAEQERARKLFKDYAKASRDWDTFRRDQDLKSLSKAAKTLEESYRLLHADEDFWAQLRSLPNKLETEDQKAEVEASLQDFDSFLAFEERLLVEVAQLPRQEVVRLLDDVNAAVHDRDRALRMVRSRADMDAIENLRDRSKDLQEALRTIQDDISAVLASEKPDVLSDPRRYRWVNGVRTSLLFLSGAGLASFNLFLLEPGNPQTPSVISGTQSMIQQFPEDLLEKLGKGVRDVGNRVIDAGRTLWERFRG